MMLSDKLSKIGKEREAYNFSLQRICLVVFKFLNLKMLPM